MIRLWLLGTLLMLILGFLRDEYFLYVFVISAILFQPNGYTSFVLMENQSPKIS